MTLRYRAADSTGEIVHHEVVRTAAWERGARGGTCPRARLRRANRRMIGPMEERRSDSGNFEINRVSVIKFLDRQSQRLRETPGRPRKKKKHETKNRSRQQTKRIRKTRIVMKKKGREKKTTHPTIIFPGLARPSQQMEYQLNLKKIKS